MRAAYDQHVHWLTPETPEDHKACGFLRRTPWKFHRAANAWAIPAFAAPGLPDPLKRHCRPPRLPGRPDLLLTATLPESRIPYPFQREDIARLVTEEAWGLWVDAGCGKTTCALGAYSILRQQAKADGMIVLGPEAARHVWVGEESDSNRWLSETGHLVKRGAPLPAGGIIFCSFDKTFREPYAAQLLALLRTGRWVLCIDEAHMIAGHLSKRFQMVDLWVRFCRWRWLLTASFMPNYPDSFWALYRLLTRAPVSREEWVLWFQNPDGSWNRPRLAALAEHLKQFSVVREKRIVAPWLPKNPPAQVFKVPLRGRQRQLYDEMITTGRTRLAEEAGSWQLYAREWFTRMIYAASIASHPIVAGEEAHDSEVSKYQYLLDLLEASGGQKVTVWSWHPEVLNRIHSYLTQKRPFWQSVLYHGGVGARDREKAILGFNTDDSVKVFLGNPSAAGTSLNLGAGTVRIYWDMDWSATEFYQSGERIDRILDHRGRPREVPITTYILLAEGTVEEYMWEMVQRKLDLRSVMMSGGGDSVWTPKAVEGILQRWMRVR